MRIGNRLQLVSSIAVLTATLGAGTALAQTDGSARGFDHTDPADATDAVTTQAAGDSRVPSKTAIKLKGLKNGDLTVGNKVTVAGTLRPYVKGQKVTVELKRGKKTIARKKLNVRRKGSKGKVGKFSFSDKLIKPGRYAAEAFHDKNASLGGSKDSSRRFHIRYPDLGEGASGDAVKVFNNLLANLGYVNDENHTYNSATGRAVLAFRKVNGMARKESATVGIFKRLAKGKGGFQLKHPGARQARRDGPLAPGDGPGQGRTRSMRSTRSHRARPLPRRSSASTTSTARNRATTASGWYYSVYFIRGYATHGYASVPTIRQAMAACATRFPTRSTSTTGSTSATRSTCIGERPRHAWSRSCVSTLS